jgi:hypothetical protein
VYGVTRGLARAHGSARVFDTLLDEQTILGLALGAGVSGLLPVPEIQYLAYLHNAEDQLRGEAATLPFFSAGRYRNPLVVRIAGYAYQKGFGGHFHNDNAVGVLRDVPGLVIASPARPDDAAAMLRTCVAAAEVDGAVCAFLEPIALYHTRDLHTDGDGGWLAPDTGEHVPVGSARVHGDGRDLTIISWANGLRMSLRVRPGSPAAVSASAWWTCAGSPRCRSTTCCAPPAPPAGCWWSTRPGAAGACRRACSPRWSTRASPVRWRGSPRRTASSAGGRRRARPGVGGRHRGRRAPARAGGRRSGGGGRAGVLDVGLHALSGRDRLGRVDRRGQGLVAAERERVAAVGEQRVELQLQRGDVPLDIGAQVRGRVVDQLDVRPARGADGVVELLGGDAAAVRQRAVAARLSSSAAQNGDGGRRRRLHRRGPVAVGDRAAGTGEGSRGPGRRSGTGGASHDRAR